MTTAETSGVIVDAADYYHAFYWAARNARRSILVSGWEFDSGVPLLRGADAPAGAEVRLLKFLNGLCERNPDLYVCLLAWDFHLVLAGEREWLQHVYFHWLTHEHLHSPTGAWESTVSSMPRGKRARRTGHSAGASAACE
jgi:hypothetical protein